VYGPAVETRFPLRDRTSPDVGGGSRDGIGGHRGNTDFGGPGSRRDPLHRIHGRLRRGHGSLGRQPGISASGQAQVWRWTGGAIGHVSNRTVPTDGFTATYPARSLTLYVIPS